MRECFKRLYKRRVYVHHYAEYMDISMFDDAYSAILLTLPVQCYLF
jgi:hypothetical protein